jgi:hypothetical protein
VAPQLKVPALDADCLLGGVAGNLQHLQLNLVDGVRQLHNMTNMI